MFDFGERIVAVAAGGIYCGIVIFCDVKGNYVEIVKKNGEIVYEPVENVRPAEAVAADVMGWFAAAKPNPTTEDLAVQIGCHFEEVAEMVMALDVCYEANRWGIGGLAEEFKCKDAGFVEVLERVKVSREMRRALLDAIIDQAVTGQGICQFLGMDYFGALAEVNRSNWSKFEDGKPVFDENGKIKKGKDYTPPDLDKYIGMPPEEESAEESAEWDDALAAFEGVTVEGGFDGENDEACAGGACKI